jgi:hypothetical protein
MAVARPKPTQAYKAYRPLILKRQPVDFSEWVVVDQIL